MTIHINTLADLPAAAGEFLQAIGERRIIVFYGEMGAGKTTFIKALCDVLQVDDVIISTSTASVASRRSSTSASTTIFRAVTSA